MNFLNEMPDGESSVLPEFGMLTRGGTKVFGIRHEDHVLLLPGSHAIEFCLRFAEFVTEKTGSIDRALLDDLIARTDRLGVALRGLIEDGATHADPTRTVQ